MRKRYPIKRMTGVFGHDSEQKRFNGKADVCYYITYKIDGTKKTEKVGWVSEGYTPQLASEIRAQRVREARHEGDVKTSKEIRAERQRHNRTLGEIKEHYFNSEHGKTIKGKRFDLNRWENHLSYLESKSVPELSQLEIERIKRTMKQGELKPATIDHTLRLLRRIIKHGMKHNLCPDLAFRIEFPKVNNIVTEFLTPEEAQRLLSTLNGWKRQDVARMIKIAWLTGMRRGELFQLKRQDLNLTHDLITITDPKGGKDATVPMSPPVRKLFEEQIAFLESEQSRRERRYLNTTKPAPKWEDHGFIFPGVHGERRTECTAVDRIKEEAGLPKNFRPFHGLRHHLAVTLASSGEYTLDMIGELLTHKDSSVTRRYAAFLPEAKQKAATRAAEILNGHAATPQENKIVKLRVNTSK